MLCGGEASDVPIFAQTHVFSAVEDFNVSQPDVAVPCSFLQIRTFSNMNRDESSLISIKG